ncbi:MAG: hypothetical protein K9J13_15255 [Saprospiraceae bacterium]|nr:hypothetical protein [Saprospiraceae bacterium]
MKLVEVNNRKTEKEFLDVARIIYKNDDVWVCPLDSQLRDVFNPEKNVFFQHGEAIRWILKNEKGKLIGRVAAFINNKKAYNFDQPTGGMGFFECINDKASAYILFDKCREWLSERGMEAMDGPINFGENDNFWGLLVDGFTHPAYGMQYHPTYYRDFFESYGFKFYFEQISNHLDLTVPFPERFWKIAAWISKKPIFRFEHFKFANAEKYLLDIKEVYDTAWEFHENNTPVVLDDMRRTLKTLKNVIDEEFVWFAYAEDKPIAFLVMFPDVNQIIKHFKGKMNIINKFRFNRMLKNKTINRSRITIMGVVPKYQKSGVESGIFWHLQQVFNRKTHYKEIELSWVGDFNPKMRVLHESVGAKFAKRHITYRKLFDESKDFHRSTIIPKDTKEKAIKK